MSYLANSDDPSIGMDWTNESFNDAGWLTGTFGVGYDTNGLALALIDTEVPQGTLSIFTRATFNISNTGAISTLFLGADYDDGYVVWINGVEVFRSEQMPSGPLDWTVPGMGAGDRSIRDSPSYVPYHEISTQGIPLLREGDNLAAIGVWNRSALSSDLLIVPRLVANKGLQLTRKYLQSGTPTSMRVLWGTDLPADGRVLYGVDPANLTSRVSDPALVRDHEFLLSDLEPDTRYYYAIGNSAEILAGGDSDHYFVTSPLPGTSKPTRIWVLGDSGTDGLYPVRDAYATVTGTQETDLCFLLGDSAYPIGTDEQYQQWFFDVVPDTLRNTVVWPSIGNHDLDSGDSTLPAPYFDIFSLPTKGEAGGLPSGAEAYYSFDYANVHFVVLDSHGSDRSTPQEGGEMLTWLQADLALTDQLWIIAYWHHSPYSDGSSKSDVWKDQIEMRENAVPILETAGVDLIMTGHSHTYERSFLIDGHYGDSSTFGPQHIVDGGSGREDEPGGPYLKSSGLIPHEGTVYVVAGSSGVVHPEALQHPAMFVVNSSSTRGWNELGSVILEIQGNRLDFSFLDTTAPTPQVLDYFTLIKGNYCPGRDPDFDGECGEDDNCPNDYNPCQIDTDGDGIGNACDLLALTRGRSTR